MSRIGRKAVPIPKGALVTASDGKVTVKGAKGELDAPVPPRIHVDVADGHVLVTRDDDEQQTRAWHGLTRALVANMVTGVTAGFQKTLEIVGVGWRAQMQGKKLVLSLGYSHPVEYEPPHGIEISVENPVKFVVKGIDKQAVGQVCADIRAFRPPEPYHGKGIRYSDENVIRKAGKTGKAGAK
ncbi:MAG: 50S ribosomal protein L6 [Synergistaceae bacterium]|jgi:large subunit ribosomal protein L6|nr:50S ribosomal protein L6 [Synergistaceae bacterium]